MSCCCFVRALGVSFVASSLCVRFCITVDCVRELLCALLLRSRELRSLSPTAATECTHSHCAARSHAACLSADASTRAPSPARLQHDRFSALPAWAKRLGAAQYRHQRRSCGMHRASALPALRCARCTCHMHLHRATAACMRACVRLLFCGAWSQWPAAVRCNRHIRLEPQRQSHRAVAIIFKYRGIPHTHKHTKHNEKKHSQAL